MQEYLICRDINAPMYKYVYLQVNLKDKCFICVFFMNFIQFTILLKSF